MISPDGRSIVYLQGGSTFVTERKMLHIARLEAQDRSASHGLNMGALWQFSQAPGSMPAYRWASDSSGVWTATREKLGPEGFARSGLQPALISLESGNIRLFEPPRHAAGSLDGLLWADGDGLALAHFGARGSSYQPQRHDPNPTFAMIDAKRGVVLDTLPFDIFPNLRDAYYIANLHNAAATRLQNGKVHAVLSALNQWVVWTQGERPRMLVNPYSAPAEATNKIAMSRDGSRLLLARLQCDGGYEDARQDRGELQRSAIPPRCKPAESVVAALYDLLTGHQLWEIRATVDRVASFPNPAISDDGRYALVALPYNGPHSQIALISMVDGRILQTVRSPSQGSVNSIGFVRQSRGMWVHGDNVTVLYDLGARAQ